MVPNLFIGKVYRLIFGKLIGYFRFKPEVDNLRAKKASLFRFDLPNAVRLRGQPPFSDNFRL